MRGRAIETQLPDDSDEWVPETFFVEVAATIRRAELNQRVTLERASAAFDRLLAGTQHRVQVRSLLREAWVLRHNFTIGDALYVVLARQLGAVLVTADRRLANAPGIGVRVIAPPASSS